MTRRKLPIVVVSDVHLGTYGCHATELLLYLKSIEPEILILNGDIIDGWLFSKRYFPAAHFAVIKEIFKLITLGTKVIYLTGNHDEFLRKYSDIEMGNLTLADKFILTVGEKKIWIFHGDVFDNTTQGSAKFLAKLGGKGYDLLILINRAVNFCLKLARKEKVSFSKRVKNGVKQAMQFINNFEVTIADLAIEKKYDYVICGHIHQPTQKEIKTANGSVVYLNSGDWIENLTALEYENYQWKIFQYNETDFIEQKQILPKYSGKHKINFDEQVSLALHLN